MSYLSVLIIDDDSTDRYIIKRMLRELDLKVSIFEKSDAKEALRLVEQPGLEASVSGFPPQFILLDINMPMVDGHDFFKNFAQSRLDSSMADSKVIVLTSSDRDDDSRRSQEYDFVTGYLVKGKFTQDQLRLALTA